MSTTSTIPGQHRKALLAAVGAVLVAAALVVLAGSPALAAISTVQETDREHTQYGRWMFTQDPAGSGGWETTSRTPGATATLRFKGSMVAWKTLTYDGGGVTDVFLDGKKVTSFDVYSSTQHYDVTGFSRKGLARGNHTLKLVVTGTRGPGAPPGDVWSILDRFVVDGATIEENSRKISYDGWEDVGQRRGFRRDLPSGRLGDVRREMWPAPRGSPARPDHRQRTYAWDGHGPALDTFDNSVAAEVTVNLHAPKVEWQHAVPITGLQASKTYILEVVSADGAPVVFDGCVGPVSGPVN
jgi:hypothetical protein